MDKEKLLKTLSELLSDDSDDSKDTKEEFPYVIIRTYSAGVFAGNLVSLEGKHAVLKNVRRIWKWDGAASLSQLAEEGTSKPDECKFPCEVKMLEVTEVIEILHCSQKGKTSIKEVPAWTA